MPIGLDSIRNPLREPPTANHFMTTLEPLEHRSKPRYRRLLPVRVGNLELVTSNVSLSGMQLVCPLMRFKGIEADVRSGQLSAQITLPSGTPVEATLPVRYFSQYKAEMLVGVELTVSDPDMQAKWAAYIDDLAADRL